MSHASDPSQALARILDEIVPPSADGRLPGAGALGLARVLAERPDVSSQLESGLEAVDAVARDRGHAGFAEIPPGPLRREVLEASVDQAPAFLPTLIARTLLLYYQDARVQEKLGLRPGPPFPQGYPVGETDFSILDPVRTREPFYRIP